jgi:hypothetical protein
VVSNNLTKNREPFPLSAFIKGFGGYIWQTKQICEELAKKDGTVNEEKGTFWLAAERRRTATELPTPNGRALSIK